MSSIVIVGNGPAGRKAAEALRARGCDRDITIVSEEKTPFYPRPKLSLGYLAGSLERDALFQAPDFYSKNAVSLLFGSVSSVAPADNTVMLSDGSLLKYSALLIASGSSPAAPPWEGGGLNGVFSLRTLADADNILAAAEKTDRVVVIGGGILGVEVAEAMRKRGKTVSILVHRGRDAVGAPALSPDKCEERCRKLIDSGIEVLTCQDTEKMAGTGGALTEVVTKQGMTIKTSVAVVAIGTRSNVKFLEGSGIQVGRGVVVDSELRTAVENIFAAGDVAELSGEGIEKQRHGGPYITAMKQGEYAAGKILEL